MSAKKLAKKAEKLLDTCRKKKLRLVTAESCTGGLVAALLTDIPGSSDVLDCGFVTYSNQSKTTLLGVDPTLLKKFGAVSKEVAEAMARGALKRSQADIAIAVTGIAGPTGGTKKKPVGLVYIATATRHYADAVVVRSIFTGKRSAVRTKSAEKSLAILQKLQAFF